MKRIISKNIIFLGSIAALFFTSCSKEYLDVNNDPNRVTDSTITPELIFPAAAVEVGGRAASGNFDFLDHWMGYFAPNADFVPDFKEQTYKIDFSFGDALFQNHYNVLFDLHQVKVKSLVPGGDTVLAAASMILSAKLFQELVDLYGDIPYSQAFQVDQYPKPAYDKAQDVYNSLLLSLDTAIDYMGLSAPKSFAPTDIVNGGDQTKWIKFANTLKLRLLLRQSEIPGFDPSAEINKIESSGGPLGAGESVSLNPGYINDVDKQNPYYANFGYTPTRLQSTTSDDANDYIVTILTNNSDPRLGRFFQPVGSSYVGNIFGNQQANSTTGANSSYFGPGLIGNGLSDGTGATMDQFIMPSYESMFFTAEAIARKWIQGDAKSAYNAAVTESFVWLKVPNADSVAMAYLDPDAVSAPIADFDNAGGTATSQAKFIAYQKYIANCGIDPLESYSDQRRLKFLPDNGYISINPAKVSNTLPLRLLYPQSEYTTNGSSVEAEGTIDPFTTKLFWEP